MAAKFPLRDLRQDALCSICQEFYKDPVTIDCGHNFCHFCLTKYMEQPDLTISCPECKQKFNKKNLKPNKILANMADNIQRLEEEFRHLLGGSLCEEHGEALRLFCDTDETLICLRCRESPKHQRHRVRPIKEAHEDYKDKLCNHMEHLKKQLKDLHKWIEEEKRKASELEDVKSVLGRCSEVKALKPQEDAPGMETTLQRIRRHAQLIAELQETFPAEMEWRYVKSCEREVTLDPGTAHPRLIVSQDGRSVRRGARAQDLPDTPQRFTKEYCVLGREGLSSGRHYWEVEVGGCPGWSLGVCDESLPRKERLPLSPERGFWTVGLWGGKYKALTSPRTPLSPRAPPRVLGFFLDYEAGRFSVYDARDRALLFTFPRASFPRTLRPYFWIWSPEGELRILPGAGGD